jgi:hypothetical protein
MRMWSAIVALACGGADGAAVGRLAHGTENSPRAV